MLVSVIIRTYNESRYLRQLLIAIREQELEGLRCEVIVVDSGSTDQTLDIAGQHGARVVHIAKQEFSFGRSLNVGCQTAQGDCMVFISGHCVPASREWLARLVAPLREGRVAMTYGKQRGGPETKFSERRLFAKFYPDRSAIPQEGFFCNNANSAVARQAWERFRFDEELTGLEDLKLGSQLAGAGSRIGYVAEAPVFHYHHETWSGIRRRYEREAIALQHIMPEIHLSLSDFLRFLVSAVGLDISVAARESGLLGLALLPQIFLFRLMQFWGSYKGNHEHRQISQQKKEVYFYPR